MDASRLIRLGDKQLADYLWKRLRKESPVDPPLGHRFGDEEPEEFVIAACKKAEGPEFRNQLRGAIEENLTRLAFRQSAEHEAMYQEKATDEQIASLAFLISELEIHDLVGMLVHLAMPWARSNGSGQAFSFGQSHVLRTIAQLQDGSTLAPFWSGLWAHGPKWFRGLIIFGWARADQQAAFARLDDLVAAEDEVDLSGAIWSLIDREGPGLVPLAKAAAKASPATRARIREVFDEDDDSESRKHQFDLYADPPKDAPPVESFLTAIVGAADEFPHKRPDFGLGKAA